MARKLQRMFALTVALGALAVACGKGASLRSVAPVPSSSVNGVNGVLGDVISPSLDHNYVFEKATPPVDIQPGSTSLADNVHKVSGLHFAALKSTRDSAAILLVEDDPKVPWGTLLRPAERAIYEKFAADPSLGDWLILLDDVIVQGPRDPVPLTAYRWARADVERYVACGIPDTGQNECSKTFFLVARTVIIQKAGGPDRGK